MYRSKLHLGDNGVNMSGPGEPVKTCSDMADRESPGMSYHSLEPLGTVVSVQGGRYSG